MFPVPSRPLPSWIRPCSIEIASSRDFASETFVLFLRSLTCRISWIWGLEDCSAAILSFGCSTRLYPWASSVGDSSSIQRLRDWWRPLHSSDLAATPHSSTTFLAIDKNLGTDRRRLRVELSATGRQPLDFHPCSLAPILRIAVTNFCLKLPRESHSLRLCASIRRYVAVMQDRARISDWLANLSSATSEAGPEQLLRL